MVGLLIHAVSFFLADFGRLILYFPVSSLVTLFANVLQNPQDIRARSDVKLMNQVVNFLSLLSVTEEQGGVKRMLGVCAEFERIAKVVLEKSDKESKSRKRKSKPPTPSETSPPQRTNSSTPQKRPHPSTPIQAQISTPAPSFTPGFTGDIGTPFDPTAPAFTTGTMPDGDLSMSMDFGDGDFSGLSAAGGMNRELPLQPNQIGPIPAADGLNIGSFQQPFVPQDLWQMPMTLEWDWADVANSGLSGNMGVNGQDQQPNGQNHHLDDNADD